MNDRRRLPKNPPTPAVNPAVFGLGLRGPLGEKLKVAVGDELSELLDEVADGAVASGLRKEVAESGGEGSGLVPVLFGEAGRSALSPCGGNDNEFGGSFDPNMPLLDWKNEPIPVANVAAPFLATSTPASRAEPIGGASSVFAGVAGAGEPPLYEARRS